MTIAITTTTPIIAVNVRIRGLIYICTRPLLLRMRVTVHDSPGLQVFATAGFGVGSILGGRQGLEGSGFFISSGPHSLIFGCSCAEVDNGMENTIPAPNNNAMKARTILFL